MIPQTQNPMVEADAVFTFYRGHSIIRKNKEWLYCDNMRPVAGNERICDHCKKANKRITQLKQHRRK